LILLQQKKVVRSEQFVFGNVSALLRTSIIEVLFSEIKLHHYASFYYLPYYQIWNMERAVVAVLLSLQNRDVVKNRARDPH
jgi:hypothetical protein